MEKKPLQIYLRTDQMNALRALAERRGDSMASLVRAGVDILLRDLPPEEDSLLEVVGLFDSELGDLAESHDEYLVSMITKESQSGG